MARTAMPRFYGRDKATGVLAHQFDPRFFLVKPTCSAPFPVYPGRMDSLQYNGREIYENRLTSHCCKAVDSLFTYIRLLNNY
jgi:hypothetical protein